MLNYGILGTNLVFSFCELKGLQMRSLELKWWLEDGKRKVHQETGKYVLNRGWAVTGVVGVSRSGGGVFVVTHLHWQIITSCTYHSRKKDHWEVAEAGCMVIGVNGGSRSGVEVFVVTFAMTNNCKFVLTIQFSSAVRHAPINPLFNHYITEQYHRMRKIRFQRGIIPDISLLRTSGSISLCAMKMHLAPLVLV